MTNIRVVPRNQERHLQAMESCAKYLIGEFNPNHYQRLWLVSHHGQPRVREVGEMACEDSHPDKMEAVARNRNRFAAAVQEYIAANKHLTTD